MKKFSINNNVLLIVFVVTFILAANAILGFVLISQSKAAMKSLFQTRMLDISNTAADMLNGDILKSLKAEDKGTENYQQINDTLKYFQDNIELKYIYCIQPAGDKEFVFSVDPTIEDPGEFGSPIVYTDALYKASQGTAAVDEEPYTDAWGTFYSAYSPVFDSAGKVAGIVAVDFSAQWYENQISQQENTVIVCMVISLLICIFIVWIVTGQLRQRVKNMTKDLQHALEIAESASRAKTIFLSNMSHEIRTPMNAIIGLDHLALENKDLSDITRKQLEKIGSSAKHLLSLINDILDMSRIESGRTVIKNEEFSFVKMLDQVNVIIESQCKDKGLNYDVRLIGSFDDFYIGDDNKLRQILINILGNAVKFTPQNGNVTLQVEEIEKFDNKAKLKFTVSDTGIGMSKEYLPKIFDAFSQENSEHTNKYGSTGLGMAITKGLIEKMNGNISVESEKGAGTVFTIIVTLTRSDKHNLPENKIESAEYKEINSQVFNTDLTGRKILLAEDMPVNAEIMTEILKMKDIEVEHAENGKIAVEKFNAQPDGYYDAILMDMQMPVMDGLEATKNIRNSKHKYAKTIPIIALTANAFDEDMQRSIQAGMNSHLTKPIEPELIYRTLAEFFQLNL